LLVLTWDEKAAIEELFQSSTLREMATSLSHREEGSTVAVRGAAHWMKGYSSLRSLPFAALVEV
jgi:hypothetical protein